MLPNRVHISKRSTDLLRQIKAKTGVTPNILCRMALTLSLDENHKANPESTDLNGLEFNISTLLGDFGPLYSALIRQTYGSISSREAQLVIAAHIDNGVDKLKRVKSVGDLMRY